MRSYISFGELEELGETIVREYTDAVDDVLVRFFGAKKKNFKIICQEV